MKTALVDAASLFSREVQALVADALARGPTATDPTVGACLRRKLPSEISDADIEAILIVSMCASPALVDADCWGGAGSPALLPSRAVLGLPLPPPQHHAAPTMRSSRAAVETLARRYQQRQLQLQQAAAGAARAEAARRAQQQLAKQAEAERQRRLAFEQVERERLAREAEAAQARLASDYEAAQTQALAQRPKPRGVTAVRAATHKMLLEKLRQGGWISAGMSAPATPSEQREVERREAAHAARRH